jgi:hypothetical protein
MMLSSPRSSSTRHIPVTRPSVERTLMEIIGRLEALPRDVHVADLLIRARQCERGLEASIRLAFDDELCDLLAAKVAELEDACLGVSDDEPVSVVFFRR